MKSYLDLTAIDNWLLVEIQLEPIGVPEVSVITPCNCAGGKLFKPVNIQVHLELLKPFFISVELKNKIYNDNTETAVIIKSLQIDGIDLIPRFDYMATYTNDQHHTSPTSHLDYNGQWTLTFDLPFYQWLHQATGQGWLLS